MRKILAEGLFVFLLSTGVAQAGWPINMTPKVEGVVVDSTTGKPIENVIVTAAHEQTYLIGGPGGPGSFYNSNSSVTDKDGKYVISHKLLWNFLSKYNYTTIYYSHPLYDKMEVRYNEKRWGTFKPEIKLTSYAVRYKELVEDVKAKSKDEKEFNDKLVEARRKEDISFMPYYGNNEEMVEHLMRRKEKYKVRYDLDYVFQQWKEVGIEMYGSGDQWFENKISEVEKSIEELKSMGY